MTVRMLGVPILPVFAGMIPEIHQQGKLLNNSPRIRGDDPSPALWLTTKGGFSPYSRG